MLRHRTQLLALLVLLTGGTSLLAYGRLDKRRADALAGERDLRLVHNDLAQIASSAGGNRPVAAKSDESEFVRRVSDIAANSGVQLTDRGEPGIPKRLGSSDFSELPLYLRFDSITLRQLTVFLTQLASSDAGSRTRAIELRPREVGAAGSLGSDELWTADVEIAYLIHAPKDTKVP